jgi:hypothetical protein
VLVGTVVGTTITRHQVQLLRAEIAQLEQSRARLQENADALASALREARAPLAGRIHELETALAAREVAPRPEEPAEALAAVAAAEPAPSRALARMVPAAAPAREPVTPEPTAPLEEPTPRAAPPPAPGKERVAQRDAPSPPRRERPAPPPAVSAPPPPAERLCRPIPEPEFALASPDQAVQRFTGDLVLGIDASGPDLVMRLGDGTRHPLVGLPLHVATQCDDLSYIVSICVADPDPFEVRGVISPAHAWDKPCRALLRARGQTGP